MNMMHRRNHFPQQLSGGQQQRVVRSRNSERAAADLADEPTGNLDTANGDDVMKMLTTLNDQGTTVVMVCPLSTKRRVWKSHHPSP